MPFAQRKESRTCATTASVDNPYFSCSVGRAPASRNWSGRPIGVTRRPTPRLTSAPCHGFEQAADHGVVLRGERDSVGVELSDDRVLVEWLERRAVDHGDLNAVLVGEPFCGEQGPHRHQTGGDDHDVVAGADDFRLAHLEGVVVAVQDPWDLAAQQPRVRRPVQGRGGGDDGLDVHGVRGVEDRQVGHPAQDRDILGGLVEGP